MRIDQPPLSKRKPVFRKNFSKIIFLLAIVAAAGIGFYYYGLPLLSETQTSQSTFNNAPNAHPSSQVPNTQENPPLRRYIHPFVKMSKSDRELACILFLNEDTDLSEKALAKLPKEVCIALDPTIPNVEGLAEEFYQKGHEIVSVIALEPESYPLNDPGNHTILTNFERPKMEEVIKGSLKKIPYAFAVTHRTGTFFTGKKKSMHTLLSILKSRGVAFVDTYLTPKSVSHTIAQTMGIPFLKTDYTSLSNPISGLNQRFLNQTMDDTKGAANSDNKLLIVALAISEETILNLCDIKAQEGSPKPSWATVPLSYALNSKKTKDQKPAPQKESVDHERSQ